VLGNAKGVVAVVLSLIYFRNPVNFYSVFGYGVTVTGVVMYSQVGPLVVQVAVSNWVLCLLVRSFVWHAVR